MSLFGRYFRSVEGKSEGLLARYSDLVLVAGIVMIICAAFLPLPLWVIDVLVALSMAAGLTILLMAVYIGGPLEFSVFPSVLLITTLLRLMVSVAATRSILLHADGGHIIDTFGRLVAGGNLVVGLVVFLIIMVVQFIVIAKGAERVAEVAARFTLDAMPGKQLSIDSDLRSGLIDKDEAKRRRRVLEQESKLHGSLDGAMKFVKGDAIAGIVIVLINLLGGLAIGVMQRGMGFGEAMSTYSILTIGEGLVAQIPALLGAFAAGLIVTRSNDEDDRHLGDAMRKQMTAKPRVLIVAGGICMLMALVPGFPSAVFAVLGLFALISGMALLPAWRERFKQHLPSALKRAQYRRDEGKPKVATTAALVPRPSVPLLLRVPPQALRDEHAAELTRAMEGMLDEFQISLGLALPRISIYGDAEPDLGWQLLAYEVPLASGPPPGRSEGGPAPSGGSERSERGGTSGPPPGRSEGGPAPSGGSERSERGGTSGPWPQTEPGEAPGRSAEALARAVREVMRRHAPMFIGVQEATALLTRASAELPDVIKEVLRALPMQKVAEVLRRLVAEEVSIRNLRDILEALAEAGQREKDVQALAEFARIALKRQISHRVADKDGRLKTILLRPEVEDLVRQAVRTTGGVTQLALETEVSQALVASIRNMVERHQPHAVVTSVDVRWHLRKLIEPDCFDVPVLSFHELAASLRVEVVAHVGIPNSSLLEAA